MSSLWTQFTNIIKAPIKSTLAADPLLSKLRTGHLQGGFKGFKARTAAGVHEIYKTDKLAQKLGIKESAITNVVMVVGAVVAIYFTAGAASSAMGGGAAAGAGGAGAAGAAGGISAGTYLTGATTLYGMSQQQQAKKKADDEAKAAQVEAAKAQAAALDRAAAPGALSETLLTPKNILAVIAIAAALL